jgi:hypothetical protein
MNPMTLQAIQTALKGDWQKAILLNQQILRENPHDIDALNRLGFAHLSLGQLKQAKHAYQQVLSLDVQNPIALKNLKRITNVNSKTINQRSGQMNNIFIEEPGKTKVIDLINVAEQKVIGELRCGEMLTLGMKRMKIFLFDAQQQYIGMLPDDLSKRLIRFMKGGNKYEAYVKTISNHRLTVFLRETKRVSRYKNQPSFAHSEKTKLMLTPAMNKWNAKHKESENLDSENEEEERFSQSDGSDSF